MARSLHRIRLQLQVDSQWNRPDRTPFESISRSRRSQRAGAYGERRTFDNATVSNPFHREVSVHEDRYGRGEWRVKDFDAGGRCWVTVFAGPRAAGKHSETLLSHEADAISQHCRREAFRLPVASS